MATFTQELRNVDRIHNVTKSSLMGYPIFDEGYRIGLNKKILDHYWMQEIAFETSDLFLFSLRRKMNEIMPFYNDLYRSQRFEFDPMSTIDFSVVNDSHNVNDSEFNNTSESTNESESTSRSVTSDFPQNSLSGNGDYATSGADSSGITTAGGTAGEKGEQRGTGVGHSETRHKGRTMPGSELLASYRASLLNVDMMVIDELSILFMPLWGIADNFPDEPFPYHYPYV